MKIDDISKFLFVCELNVLLILGMYEYVFCKSFLYFYYK